MIEYAIWDGDVVSLYIKPAISCHSDGAQFACDVREIDENALEQALSAAVTCTILAGAGPQRSRVLATLYKVLLLYAHINVLGLCPSTIWPQLCHIIVNNWIQAYNFLEILIIRALLKLYHFKMQLAANMCCRFSLQAYNFLEILLIRALLKLYHFKMHWPYLFQLVANMCCRFSLLWICNINLWPALC